jgi:drug/metabolite transporter, DME family
MTPPEPAVAAPPTPGPPARDPRYPRGAVMVMAGAACLALTGIFLRNLEQAGGWQVLFWRSWFYVLTVAAFLAIRHRGRIAAPFLAIGRTGLAVALLLTVVFIGFIFAMLLTTVANVVFTLGASPFVAALLGYLVLGERIRRATAVAIVFVLLGVGLMVADGLTVGRIEGNLVALVVMTAFATQIVLLRRARAVDMVPAGAIAGVLTAMVAAAMAAATAESLAIGLWDLFLCFLLGTVNIGAGVILITTGARFVPAAEAALFSLTEAVLAPVLVWLVVGETPSLLTLAGGGVVLSAVLANAISGIRRERARMAPALDAAPPGR